MVPAAAVPGSTDHRPKPVTTQQREDDVLMRESFDDSMAGTGVEE